jgi:RimJ/RimL family protein N-acetyltransferase
MLIRTARQGDHDPIWEILRPIIRAGESYALPIDMSREESLAYWLSPAHQAFVAERDGEVIGTYYMRPNQPGGGNHVANCGYATAGTAQGQGVARAMCAHSLDTATQCGFRAIQFNFVVATNQRAVDLWLRMGFRIVGRLPGAFKHPQLDYVDALVMYQTL